MTDASDPKDCPYVGLDPFEKRYEPFFFGREQDSRAIADHVAARQITVLYGASGVGKSSILNVGLPAGLRERAQRIFDTRSRVGKPREPTEWIVVTLRDWQDPDTIEQRATEELLAALPASLRIDPRHARFGHRVVCALRKTGRPLLLILDQFEEYFLYRTGSPLTWVETGMSALLARRDLDVHVLIAVRDDSLHVLDKLRAVVPGILETTVRLGHLNAAGAEQAIRGPIRKYNEVYRNPGAPIEVEEALVGVLLRDLRQDGGRPDGDGAGGRSLAPIELPYLQLTMTNLWAAEGGDAKALRLETLVKKLGGVQQIAREHVDRILSELTVKEQALCADIFRNLVTSSGSKIAYPIKDLAKQIMEDRKQVGHLRGQDTISTEEVAAVLRKLTPTKTRLLKPVRTNGVDAVELFHDVLGQPVLRWRREFYQKVELREKQLRLRWLGAIATSLGFFAVVASSYYYQQIKYTQAQTHAAAESIVASISQTADPFALVNQAEALAALPTRLSDAQAAAAVEPVLAAFERTNDPDALRALAQGLEALAPRLSEAQAQAAANSVLAAINRDPATQRDLERPFRALATKLPEAQASKLIRSLK